MVNVFLTDEGALELVLYPPNAPFSLSLKNYDDVASYKNLAVGETQLLFPQLNVTGRITKKIDENGVVYMEETYEQT